MFSENSIHVFWLLCWVSFNPIHSCYLSVSDEKSVLVDKSVSDEKSVSDDYSVSNEKLVSNENSVSNENYGPTLATLVRNQC